MSATTTASADKSTTETATQPPANQHIVEKNGKKSIAPSFRDRVLNGARPAPPETPEQKAKREADEKAKTDAAQKEKEAAEAKVREDAEKAKGGNAGAPTSRVKKVKAGPELPPETPPASGPSGEALREVVREVVAETNRPSTETSTPSLDPEIQREIEIARFAETKHGDKYTGMAGKVEKFFRERDQLVAAKAKELGGQKSPEFREWLDGDEFKGWIDENRPSYQRGDKAKLTEEMIADRAREEARREMEPEIKRIDRQSREMQVKPIIDQVTTHLVQKVILVDPAEKPEDKDPALTGFAANPMKFGEEHPEEARLIAQDANEVVELVSELYRIDHDLVDFDPKKPTPRQQQLREFSVQQNTVLRKEHPNGIEMQDGKILIDADTYTKRGLHKDPRYRVFNTEELAGMLAHERRMKLLGKLSQRREGVSKSIYAPKPAAGGAPAAGQNGQPPATPPEEERSPSANVSRAPNTRATPPEDVRKKRNKYL